MDGAVGLLEHGPVILAVSVYHHAADLWELPLRMYELCPDGRLWLRTHGEDGTDVVCYSTPSSR